MTETSGIRIQQLSNFETIDFRQNFEDKSKKSFKRDNDVHHLSVKDAVALYVLHYCLCFLRYNFIMLHCPNVLNSLANDTTHTQTHTQPFNGL